MSIESISSGLALLISAIAVVLSYLTAQRSRISGVRPLLVYVFQSGSGWFLRNVGNGPAMDVIVARQDANGRWIDPVRMAPLAVGDQSMLTARPRPSGVDIVRRGASYRDIHGRLYCSILTYETYRIDLQVGSPLPPWPEDEVNRDHAPPRED